MRDVDSVSCAYCRYHAVQEFNRGVFNYLIATDESGLEGLEKDSDDEASDTEAPSACGFSLLSYFTVG